MSQNPSGPISPIPGNFISGISNQVRLILRLVADPRVSPLVKLLPIGSLVYLLVPDLIVGPIDDATLMLFASYFFVELCPQEVVDEHRRRLGMSTAGDEPPGQGDANRPAEDDIIDAEYSEKKDPQP